MGKFCTKCGNPVEFCTCPKQPMEDVYSNNSPTCPVCGFPKEYCTCPPKVQHQSAPAPTPAAPSRNFCKRCGKPLNQCTCNVQGPSGSGEFCTRCGNPKSRCTCSDAKPTFGKRITDYFGFNDSDRRYKDNSLEEGKNIVPVLIDSANEEKFIKQYDVGRMRRRLTFSLGYARILVTNKRVIERSVNKSIFGKDVSHNEYAIDEIMGVTYERGKTFSVADFFLFFVIGIIASLPSFGISMAIHNFIVGGIFGLLCFIGLIFLRITLKGNARKSNFLLYLITCVGIGFCMGATGDIEEVMYSIMWDGAEGAVFNGIIMLLNFIAFLICLIKLSFLPSVALTIITKMPTGRGNGFGYSGAHVLRNFINKMFVLPADNTESAIKELGAIINDVQKFGDYAVEKWSKHK